jgi:uncharacterized protein YndB with AHSA1/START domain
MRWRRPGDEVVAGRTPPPMHALVPRDLAWMESAPVVIETARILDASAEQVFEMIADHERWPRWFRGLRGVQVTGARAGVGGTRRVVAGGVWIDEEFIGWEDGRLFAFTMTAMSRRLVLSMAEAVQVLPIEPGPTERCVVTYTMAIEPAPRTRRIVLLMQSSIRVSVSRSLRRLGTVAAEPVDDAG